MKKFHGKVLLLLGTNVGSVDIVNYARSNGAYVIVADNLPLEESKAKTVADEHVLVSTGDLDGLKRIVRDKGVTSVFAGVSEFNLLRALDLCEYFGFPFYCNRQQWNQIEHKDNFRSLCRRYGVPCPETYFTGSHLTEEALADVEYPVIVKPVDCGSSLGVSICRTRDEVLAAREAALRESGVKRIIVEEYFEGEEFSAHYTIANGNVTLSCVDNRFPVSVNAGNVTTVPVARIYPSTFLNEYVAQVNGALVELCRSLHLDTGVVFVQGLYNRKKNSFSIFEGGLRCSGEAPYRFIERINGVNFMNNIIDYVISGHAGSFDSAGEDPELKGKVCGIVSLVSRGGTVDKIIGLEDVVSDVKSICAYESRYPVGSVTPCGNTLRQIMIRFVMINGSRAELAHDISYINSHVSVLDTEGKDMCLRFDPELLLK